mgnify:CR=1 FL=1
MAANPANWRTLDIDQRQYAVRWPVGANGNKCFHNVLVYQGQGGVWAGFGEEWEPINHDLSFSHGGGVPAIGERRSVSSRPACAASLGDRSGRAGCRVGAGVAAGEGAFGGLGDPHISGGLQVRMAWVVVDVRGDNLFGTEVLPAVRAAAQELGSHGVVRFRGRSYSSSGSRSRMCSRNWRSSSQRELGTSAPSRRWTRAGGAPWRALRR